MKRISPHLKEQRMIDEVIENFNFLRCYKVMNHLNWKWGNEGIPTIDRLKESAVERIRSAMDNVKDKENKISSSDFSSVSSGGHKATAWKNRYGHIEGVRLEFVLTEWDSDGDDD
jgi:hypothetical protein